MPDITDFPIPTQVLDPGVLLDCDFSVATGADLIGRPPGPKMTALALDPNHEWRWSGTAWVDTGESPLAGKVDQVDLDRMIQTEPADISALHHLLAKGPDGKEYRLTTVLPDGTTLFRRPIAVPDGTFPLSALSPEALSALPFSLMPSLLTTACRIIGTGPDGREYVILDIPRNGSAPIGAYVSRAKTAENAGGGGSSDNTIIVSVGDSMSAAGSGIIVVLPSRFPDRVVVASAEGGERTGGMAVSFGVPDLLTLAITGNALPTSGWVTATPGISHLPPGVSALVDVIAETGLSRRCIAWNDGGTYKLRPVAYPAAAIRNESRPRAGRVYAGVRR